MTSIAFFTEDNEGSSWTVESDFVPRVGDTVSYRMMCHDKEKWDEDRYLEMIELANKDWVVSKVHCEFRRYSIYRHEVSHVNVFLRPSKAST